MNNALNHRPVLAEADPLKTFEPNANHPTANLPNQSTGHAKGYDYVSYSKISLQSDIGDLLRAADEWEPIRSSIISRFDPIQFRRTLSAASTKLRRSLIASTKEMAVEDKILHLLSSDFYMASPIEQFREHEELFRAKVSAAVAANKPVNIIVPSYPGRECNPIARTRPQVHLGEYAGLARLIEISELVGKVYGPGLTFTIVCDGIAYAPFYGDPVAGAVGYMRQLQHAVTSLGGERSIILSDLQELIDARKPEFTEVYAEVEKEILQTWNDPDYKFRDDLAMTMRMGTQAGAVTAAAMLMLKFHEPSDADQMLLRRMRSSIDAAALRTSFVYHCLLVTMRRIGVLEKAYPEAIRGTVHAKPGQYAVHLVNKETKVSPWHGVGVMRLDGRVDVLLEADILARADRYCAVYLEGEVVPFYYEEISA